MSSVEMYDIFTFSLLKSSIAINRIKKKIYLIVSTLDKEA